MSHVCCVQGAGCHICVVCRVLGVTFVLGVAFVSSVGCWLSPVGVYLTWTRDIPSRGLGLVA